MAKACIVCIKEVENGSPVADDLVISAIRAVKQSLNMAKNNKLVVCESCMETYLKKRSSYERKIALYLVIAAAIFVALAVLPIFGSGFSLVSAFYGIMFGAIIMALPVLTSHTPRLASSSTAQMAPSGKASAPNKKKSRRK